MNLRSKKNNKSRDSKIISKINFDFIKTKSFVKPFSIFSKKIIHFTNADNVNLCNEVSTINEVKKDLSIYQNLKNQIRFNFHIWGICFKSMKNNIKFDLDLFKEVIKEKLFNNNVDLHYRRYYDYKIANNSQNYVSKDFMDMYYKIDIKKWLGDAYENYDFQI